VPVVQEPIGEPTITALHEVATGSYRKCGDASVLNPDVPTVARIAALTEGVGQVGAALYDGRAALVEALVGCASVAACWGQCWAGGDEQWPLVDPGPGLRVLGEQTVADLQYVAELCARPGNGHCQLSNLPVARRIALIGVDLGKVAGWLDCGPAGSARAVWLVNVHGCLIHLAAGALMWAHHLEVSGVAGSR
jgi:hypothetical protein